MTAQCTEPVASDVGSEQTVTMSTRVCSLSPERYRAQEDRTNVFLYTYVMSTLQLAKPEGTKDGAHVFLYAYVLPTLQLS